MGETGDQGMGGNDNSNDNGSNKDTGMGDAATAADSGGGGGAEYWLYQLRSVSGSACVPPATLTAESTTEADQTTVPTVEPYVVGRAQYGGDMEGGLMVAVRGGNSRGSSARPDADDSQKPVTKRESSQVPLSFDEEYHWERPVMFMLWVGGIGSAIAIVTMALDKRKDDQVTMGLRPRDRTHYDAATASAASVSSLRDHEHHQNSGARARSLGDFEREQLALGAIDGSMDEYTLTQPLLTPL
jgi:hypothetical protein